jgi:hypothetical protein
LNQAAKRSIRWVDPVLIIVTALIAYLPLASQLGYYRDDWHVAWGGFLVGAVKIVDLHLTDRPFMGLIYSGTYAILGNAPLTWQTYTILLRIAGGLLLLWLFRLIWPGKKTATTLMALLFTLYPGFIEMPTASAYSNHLFGLGMGLLSLSLTLKALQVSRARQRILLILAAIFTGLVCFLIMEYMISLEGVRILLLAYLFAWREPGTLVKKGWRLVKIWAPYLSGLAFFLVWRVLIFKSARATTDVGSLVGVYRNQPVFMLARVLIETIKGFINTLVLAWGVPLYNLTMNANPRNLLISAGLVLLASGVFLAFLRLSAQRDDLRAENPEHCDWGKEAALLGLLVILINVIPVVLANRDIRLTDTLDRYTLPASIGAVMVLVGVLYWTVRGSLRAWLLISLIAVSIFTHYNNAAYFANFWAMEKQLWWQLSWRAPDLKKNTVLIPALPAPYMLAESYEVWGPANMIYASHADPLRVVGESLSNETMHAIITQGSFKRSMRRVELSLDFKNSLVVSIRAQGACLRVYDSGWREFSENESPLVRQVAVVSKSSLILTGADPKTPPVEVFGAEPAHTWCYYYEKADLARQKKDWAEAARLGDVVRKLKLQPQDGMEWMPFYQGYAYAGRMDDANRLAPRIRAEQAALREFCTQFGPEWKSKVKPGSSDEYVVINICPNQ